jgi:hypothetical protein
MIYLIAINNLRNSGIWCMTNWTTIEIMDVVIGIGLVNADNSITEVLNVNLPDEDEMTDEEQANWVKENNIRMQTICNFLIINDL